MNTIAISAQERNGLGKKATKAVRTEDLIPVVIYGGNQTIHASVTPKSVKDIIYSPDFKVVEIDVNGETHRCVLQNVQYHPVSDAVLHIDFLKLVEGHAIKVEIPIRFKGTSPGVKLGGKLVQSMRKLKVKTYPENLVDELFVDISNLDLGGVTRVRDVQIGERMESMSSGATPVAIIEIPRALRSAKAEAAKAEKGGKKK
jgi:large subunit ribosomal protein L25